MPYYPHIYRYCSYCTGHIGATCRTVYQLCMIGSIIDWPTWTVNFKLAIDYNNRVELYIYVGVYVYKSIYIYSKTSNIPLPQIDHSPISIALFRTQIIVHINSLPPWMDHLPKPTIYMYIERYYNDIYIYIYVYIERDYNDTYMYIERYIYIYIISLYI